MDGVAYLINETYTPDEIGNDVCTETTTEIFVTEESLTRAEWIAAGRQGLNPEIMLTTARCNYSGQNNIKYNDLRYRIYRTFTNGERIELYLERQAGA